MNCTTLSPRKLFIPSTAVLLLLVGLNGCKKYHHGSTQLASNVQQVVNRPKLDMMKWADYSDYQAQVKQFYDSRESATAWTEEDGDPTSQAKAMIQAFTTADEKGLKPEDYDASRWPQRLARIDAIRRNNDTSANAQDNVAQFDAALTISAMRYLSDLHSGRINPQQLNFDIDTPSKRKAFDLAAYLNDKVVEADDVPAAITEVEPTNPIYVATEKALPQYIRLAQQQAAAAGSAGMANPVSALLPIPAKPLKVGSPLPPAVLYVLAAHLALEGDLASAPAGPSTMGTTYSQELSDAVKHYQVRHGYTPDGQLTSQTATSLNVPLTQRVEQMNLALERWRWLPEPYDKPRVLENLAEFTLRTFEADGTLALKMRTVNGQFAGGHETPVFTRLMRYVVFRPYWNVPPSIIKKELVGHIEKSGVGYLAAKNFEVTSGGGQPVEGFSASDIEHLRYAVREKPGPTNSLGLVKFLFPNEYDVYMHSTNEPFLFNLTRRDRSHGCVRLQHPDDMAVWVLKGNDGDWDEEKVTAAMNDETANNKTITLKTPLPVAVFYLTAIADEDGTMHFVDDVYKYDAAMEQLLQKGMPYPSAPAKINPKLTPGETV